MIFPYLVFSGEAREAISFYEECFATKALSIIPYGEYIPEGAEGIDGISNMIVHAEMEVFGNKIWFADEICEIVKKGTNTKLVITVDTFEEADTIFCYLEKGGNVILPPTPTYYSTFHAYVIDKFGVCWNVVANESP